MKKKVSIIIPVYNCGEYLKNCLKSIVRQTLKEIEIICVNDGSKDDSALILKEFAKKDLRIIPISKQESGFGAACNLGLEIAMGEYVLFVRPKDYLDKNACKKLYCAAFKSNSDLTFCTQREFSDFEKKTYFKQSVQNTRGILYSCDFLNKNKLRFTEVSGKFGVNHVFRFKASCLAKNVVYLKDELYFSRKSFSCPLEKTMSAFFARHDEIFGFLASLKSFNPDNYAKVCKRELLFLKTFVKFLTKDNRARYVSKFAKVLKNMDENIILNHPSITEFEKCIYRCLTYNLETVSSL